MRTWKTILDPRKRKAITAALLHVRGVKGKSYSKPVMNIVFKCKWKQRFAYGLLKLEVASNKLLSVYLPEAGIIKL